MVGTRRRGDGATQSWVKPEVDPPRVWALPRGACSGVSVSAGGLSSSRNTFFNHEWLEFSRIGCGFATDSSCRYNSCPFVLFVVQGHPGRMGAGRGLLIDEVGLSRRRGGKCEMRNFKKRPTFNAQLGTFKILRGMDSFTLETNVLPSFAPSPLCGRFFFKEPQRIRRV